MKTLLAVIFLLALPGVTMAVSYETANQITAAVDPVTTLKTGDPIPTGDVVTYRWYYDIVGGEVEPISAGDDTTIPEKTITFAEEGQYHIGAQAVRTVDNTTVSVSVISWSDDPAAVSNGETWGILYYSPLAGPVGLHRQ